MPILLVVELLLQVLILARCGTNFFHQDLVFLSYRLHVLIYGLRMVSQGLNFLTRYLLLVHGGLDLLQHVSVCLLHRAALLLLGFVFLL